MALNYGAGATGALSGAGTGAAVGSVIPGVGTAIGAGVGGLLGGAAGLFGGGGKSEKNRAALRRRMLANSQPINNDLGATMANYGGANPTYAPVYLDPSERKLTGPALQLAILRHKQNAVAEQGAQQRQQLMADTMSGYKGVADTAGAAQDQSISGLGNAWNDIYGMQDRFGNSQRNALASSFAQQEAARAQNAARRGLNFQESDQNALAGRRQLASTALEDQLLQDRIGQRQAGSQAMYGAQQNRIGQQAQLGLNTPQYLSQLDLGFPTGQDAINTQLQGIGIQQQNKALAASQNQYQQANRTSFLNSLIGAGGQIGAGYLGNRQPAVPKPNYATAFNAQGYA